MKLLFSSLLVICAISQGFSQLNIGSFNSIGEVQAINDKVFFTAADNTYGVELHVSDGQNGNFSLLKDISPGGNSSSPHNFTVLGDQLFFVAYSSQYGRSVWKSDGTTEGTQVVYSVEYAEPSNLMVFRNKVYFTTALGSIICTDGTTQGTRVFFQADYTYGRIPTVIKTDNYIYYTPDLRTIYRDDGDFSRISFLAPLSWEDVYFKHLFALGNSLIAIKASTYDEKIRVYSLNESVLGDDEEDEWLLIKKLDAPAYGDQDLDNFTLLDGKLFFTFRTDYDNTSPTDELWVSDATEAGTKKLKSFAWDPHLYESEMGMLFTFKDNLFFRAGNAHSKSLWTSNGTSEGTVQVHDVMVTAPAYDERVPVIATDDKVYFSGRVQSGSTDIWVSDGTSVGTQKFMNLEDAQGNIPHDFSSSGSNVYFVTSAQFSATLWSIAPAPNIAVTVPWINGEKGRCSEHDFVISNSGRGNLYLESLLLNGKDFYLVNTELPEKLAPGESVTVTIVFNPVGEAESRATLIILSNDPNESHYSVSFTGYTNFSFGAEFCQLSTYVKSLHAIIPATSIVLSNSSIPEGEPVGTIVGELQFPEIAGATYELIAGEGDTDNHSFIIDGNLLKVNSIFDFNAKAVYTVRIKATAATTGAEASFRIRVVNRTIEELQDECSPVFDRMDFSFKALEKNSEGHLFTITSDGRILRSQDDGITWQSVYAGYGASLSEIIFKGTTGYASGSNILLKSENNGETWFRLYLPIGSVSFWDIRISFLNANKGFISTGDGEILFTNDGGQSWETRLTSDSWFEFRGLHFVTEDVGYAIDWPYQLVKTQNGGRTWFEVDLSGLGWNTQVYDVSFTDENTGFMTANYRLFKTTNAGSTWSEVAGVSIESGTQIKFSDEDNGFLYGGYSSYTLYKTTDGGDTWQFFVSTISAGPATGVVAKDGKVFVCNESYYSYEGARSMSVTSDGGATWSPLNYITNGTLYNIRFFNEDDGVVTGEHGVFKTHDGGYTWNAWASDIPVHDLLYLDANTLIITSDRNLYKSTDGGATTRNVLTTSTDPYLPAGKLYHFGDALFAVSWYAVYRSDDMGETWQLVSTDPGYYTQAMHFISSSVGYRIELFGSVQKTTDGGRTWNEIYTRDPSASKPFNAIFFLDETIGYAGGDHLVRSTDGGVTWKKIEWPLTDIIAIHFENEAHGYVVSRYGNVYETKDSGVTWTTIFSGSRQISNVQFFNDQIYLAGEKAFVARYGAMGNKASMPGYVFGPATVCVGDVAEYFIAAPPSMQTSWSTTAVNTEDHPDHLTVQFPDPGEYTISAKHYFACGTSETRTMTVSVSAPPEALVIEGDNPALVGSQALYTLANAVENGTTVWHVEGGETIHGDDEGVLIQWTGVSKEGSIEVLALHPSGCRSSGSMTLALEDLPTASEENLVKSITIYPNPSETDAMISSSHSGVLSVRIIDVVGREYSAMIINGGETGKVATRHLPAGLYLFEISDGKYTVTKKFIRK